MNKALETIVFGGGCFWCVEAVLGRLRGVENVVSGYAGGDTQNPTYEEVSRGSTGHVEVVKTEYDPEIIPLKTLLDVFFSSHDPTQENGQGNDIGPQYQSSIFYTTEEQRRVIDEYIKNLEEDEVYEGEIITVVRPLGKFYLAEDYHQAYYNRNRGQGYCRLVIDPKIKKMNENYAAFLKNETD